MPNRVLRDGILTSERVNKLGWAEEVFYRRLISVVDDYGRFHALPALIRAACYPLHLDKVSDADIEKWLTVCVDAALVSVYPASDGKRYLQVERFGQRVQSRQKFPAPDPSSTVAHGDPPLTTVNHRLDVDVDEKKKEAPGGACGPVEKPPPDSPADLVFSAGVRVLMAQGMDEQQARRFLGRYVKQDAQKLATLVAEVSTRPKVDAKAYIAGAFTHDGPRLAI